MWSERARHAPSGAAGDALAGDRYGGSAGVLDPEGAHLAALGRLADVSGCRILEMGCGDGRLTVGLARAGATVLAFDSDAEAIARARASLPREVAARVEYRVASALELELESGAFDLVFFSWSL